MSEVVLQVLLTPTNDGVQAHCLHMDIVTEAATQDRAIADLADLIRAQFQYGRDTNNLAAVFVPAPAEYWQKLAHARPVGEMRVSFESSSEHAEASQFVLQELELVGA